jgi:iron(III) transport system substrate-binding protein
MFPMSRKRSIVFKAKFLCFAVLSFAFFAPSASRADWQAEWDKVLAESKKEEQLSFYVGRYGQPQILDEFRKDYPWIKLVTVNGTGNQLGTRLLAESRAGRVHADLFSGGANTNYNLLYRGKVLQSFKPALILPEALDESKWLGGKHVYTDDEQEHIFVYIANTGGGSVFYNVKQVDPKEFKSYWDLMNPKWKGKITSQPLNETGLGATLQFYYYNPELGPEWIRRLYTTMDVAMGDRRLIVDWLATGKYPLCIGCRGVDKAKAQGLPVGEFDERMWKEGQGLTTGGGSISFIRGAPHPNAAKVFINWFLSRKGQILLQRSPDLYGDLAPNSRRMDIPKDMLPPQNRLIEGRKYLDVARPEYADLSPIFKLAKEIMSAREKR